jgi:hypothetical protein
MKKIVLLLTGIVLGYSLFAQRIDFRNARNQTLGVDLPEKQQTTKASDTKQSTWTEITLPYSELVTFDTAHCQFLEEYLTRGFYFTLTERSSVVINNPSGLVYYRIGTSWIMDSLLTIGSPLLPIDSSFTLDLSLASGREVYKTLEPGTYYFLSDDNGALYYKDYGDEPLTTRIEVYTTNSTYRRYTELPYSQLFDTTHPVSGQLQDTLLLFPADIHIVHSTYNPYYMNVEKAKSYLITCTLSSTTQTEGYAGGTYFLNDSLNGAPVNDIIGSVFLTGNTTKSSIYTASYTGKIKILPFTFASGISYELSVKELQTYTVPTALDAATTITSFPYTDTGKMGDGMLINCEDASLIGSVNFLTDMLYCGFPFKVHLSEGDSLFITFNVDYYTSDTVYNVGEIYIFEKSDNSYEKIGQIGFDESYDTVIVKPHLMFIAPNEMDLYILATNTYMLSYTLGIGVVDLLPYGLTLTINSSATAAIENIGAAANIKISNPVTDFVTINGSAGKNIEVYDNSGKCILKQKIMSDNEKIATSSWAKGIYFVKLTDNGKNSGTAKLIKI